MKNIYYNLVKVVIAALLIYPVSPAIVRASATSTDPTVPSASQSDSDSVQSNDNTASQSNEGEANDNQIVIETGNVQGGVDLSNQVNFNQLSFGNESISSTSSTSTLEFDGDETGMATSTGECSDCGSDLSGNFSTGDNSDNVSEADIDNSTTVNNENQADLNNQIEGEVNSGGNTSTNNEDTTIITGDASLFANILNLINVNIVGSNYLQTAYNLVGKVIGDLDLSNYQVDELAEVVKQSDVYQKLQALNKDTGDSSSNFTSVDIDNSLTINNSNQANATNTLNLSANSGSNTVSDNDGSVKVVTGNVSVAANVVNIVNTNIVGNGWTFAIINIMGEWDGDLILPSLTNFIASQDNDFSIDCPDLNCFDNIVAVNSSSGENSTNTATTTIDNSIAIDNNNEANVNNQINIDAVTGANQVDANGGNVDLITGTAQAVSNIFNQVNTTVTANNWVFGVVNVVGEWGGSIYGKPDGFEENSFGNYFTFGWGANNFFVNSQSTTAVGEETAISAFNQNTGDDSLNQSGVSKDNSISINNNNQANIDNTINIEANSGGNVAANNQGNVYLQTGDVKAVANLFNLVNSNYIGNNWTVALVNVIGGWDGDIHFGRPDLVVTEIATADPDPAVPGGYIDYYITVTNKGDAPATQVNLTAFYDPSKVQVVSADGAEVKDDQVVWTIDKIGIGEIVVKHYRVLIDHSLTGSGDVSNHSEVWSVEEDRNPDDNIADTAVFINNSGVKVGGWGFPVSVSYPTDTNQNNNQQDAFANPVYNQSLVVNKTSDAGEVVYRGQVINFTIDLFNRSTEPLFDVIVYDTLVGPDGKVVNRQQWSLGEVKPQEEITIDYSLRLGGSAPAGIYKNIASADGFDSANRYSIFPQSKTTFSLSSIDKEEIGNVVDIQYFYQPDKITGEEYEEVVILTNTGSQTVPSGQLVATYDSNVEITSNDSANRFLIPALAPGENYTITFKVRANKPSSDPLLWQWHYFALGDRVSALAVNYQVRDSANEEGDGSDVKTGQIPLLESTAPPPSAPTSINANRPAPKVLGYAKDFSQLLTKRSLPVSYAIGKVSFWSEFRNNIFSWWVWLWILLVIVLLEIYRQQQKDNKTIKQD